jgi:hypothetical protein
MQKQRQEKKRKHNAFPTRMDLREDLQKLLSDKHNAL